MQTVFSVFARLEKHIKCQHTFFPVHLMDKKMSKVNIFVRLTHFYKFFHCLVFIQKCTMPQIVLCCNIVLKRLTKALLALKKAFLAIKKSLLDLEKQKRHSYALKKHSKLLKGTLSPKKGTLSFWKGTLNPKKGTLSP